MGKLPVQENILLLPLNFKFLFSDELRTSIRAEIEQAKSALESAISLSNDALQQANHVYDEALTLIANINALSVPDINLEKLRTDAMNAIQEVSGFLVNHRGVFITNLYMFHRLNDYKTKSIN